MLRGIAFKVLSGKILLEKLSSDANFGPLKGEKEDVYRAVRTINAMESLKVLQ